MNHRFQLVVFDYDGTLVDSQHMIVRAMHKAFTTEGLEGPPLEAVRRVVGLNLDLAIAKLLPDPHDHATGVRVAESYRQAFLALRTAPDYHEPLFPGAREVLGELDHAGVRLGIATGKARRGLLASLEQNGLAPHFVTLQTADIAAGKPHPEMLERAMAEAGAGPGETAMIGDTSFDMFMAGSAGVTGIGVAWGYHDPEELRQSGAAAILKSFAELPPTLAALGAG